MNTDEWDAVIVGGGFAGVSCAAHLEAALPPTARILLLEASDRIGGRARSFTPPGCDCALDLGAHYLGRDHKRAMALARRLLPADPIFSHVDNFGSDPASRTWLEGEWRVTTKKNSFFQLQGLSRRVAWDHKVRIFESLLRYLQIEAGVDVEHPWRSAGAAELDNMTFAEWVASQPMPKWIHEIWGIGVLDIISIRPEQISMLYWLWYSAGNGGFLQMANDHRNGPQEFGLTVGLEGLLQRFAAERTSSIRIGVAVDTIDHAAAGSVVLGTTNGERIEAAQLVVAASPHAVGRTIQFAPRLSSARELLHQQPVGHAVKAVFVYDTTWWRGDGLDFLTWTTGDKATGIEWALDTSDPGGRQRSLSTFVSPQLIDAAGARATAPPRTLRQQRVFTPIPGYVEGALAAGELAAGQLAADLRAEHGWTGAALATVRGLRRPHPIAAVGYRGLRVAMGPATAAAGVARQRRGGERPLSGSAAQSHRSARGT